MLRDKILRKFIKDYDIKKLRRAGVKIGSDFHLGNSYIDAGFPFLIEIGNSVTLSEVCILAHDGSTQHIAKKSRVGKVKIGNNVFVGKHSIILPHVRIGDNVVIGAGSVVTRNIPKNSVAVGNPCKVIGTYDEYKERTLKRMESHPVYPTYHTYKSEDEIRQMKEELEDTWGYDE